MFSELNDPARQPSVYASLKSLTRSQTRLEARMESLLLFRRALASPTMCRFIPALSVPQIAHSGESLMCWLHFFIDGPDIFCFFRYEPAEFNVSAHALPRLRHPGSTTVRPRGFPQAGGIFPSGPPAFPNE